MKNPLAAILPVEERSDGVYIKITREEKERFTAERLMSVLNSAMVTNAAADKIADVITRARGVFECIGPLFLYYNPALENHITVAMTPMQATMKLSSMCIANGIRPTEGDIVMALKKKGVSYGVRRDQIKEALLNVAIYDVDLMIADGKAPVQGEDARVTLEVNIDLNARPAIKEDGTADFRNIQSFASVMLGQIIARKIPATVGIPGIAVNNEAITPTPGNDVPLPQGKNTTVSEDGQYLMAAKAGIVFRDGALIHVNEILNIAGDVDFSVGNIKYTGDVNIKGSVLPGFTIETEGNISVHGTVDSSRLISRNGSIKIDQGVIGKGTYISGKTGVQVTFAQEAALITERTLTIEKSCLLCESVCENMEAARANIIGGSVLAYHSVTVAQLGNDTGAITKLTIADKQSTMVKEKLKELTALKDKLEKELEPVKKQLKTKAAILKTAGDAVTDRHRDELKRWVDTYNNGTMKLKYIQDKMNELKKLLETPTSFDGFIKVSGNIYKGVEVLMYGMHKAIVTTQTAKTFRRSKDAGIEGV